LNDEILRDNLEKTFQQIDIASEIYLHALETAVKIVDEHLPFQAEIDKATLPSEMNKRILAREEAISTIVANLLLLSEGIRI